MLVLESCSDPIHEDYTNLLCKFEFINSVEVDRENTCWKSLSFGSVDVDRILGQPRQLLSYKTVS